jgi:hypothetical protein
MASKTQLEIAAQLGGINEALKHGEQDREEFKAEIRELATVITGVREELAGLRQNVQSSTTAITALAAAKLDERVKLIESDWARFKLEAITEDRSRIAAMEQDWKQLKGDDPRSPRERLDLIEATALDYQNVKKAVLKYVLLGLVASTISGGLGYGIANVVASAMGVGLIGRPGTTVNVEPVVPAPLPQLKSPPGK